MSMEFSKSAEGARGERREKSGLRRPALVVPLRYGLPCVECRIYYEADLDTCPICGCSDRVSPAA